MANLRQLSIANVIQVILIVVLPWGPAFLFERIDFSFLVNRNWYWYYQLSGNRLLADIASFALTGILIAYLLRPRWALVQTFLGTLFFWILLYQACQAFGTSIFTECYQTGPDGLAGYRMMLLLFSLGVLPTILRAAPKSATFNPRLRHIIAVFAGIILTVVMQWYALTAWFSGVTYLPPFPVLQGLILFGVPQLLTGVIAARIGRSLKIATVTGIISLVFVSISFWTLLCPDCDRALTYYLVAPWALFAFLGGLTELGIPKPFHYHFGSGWFGRLKAEDYRRVAVAFVVTICLVSILFLQYWDSSVLYATSISEGPKTTTLGLPSYPYVAGYYDSLQYRICCLEIGITFVNADTNLLAPDNFLMADMGVQSPNCCVDGWDLGWRADVFLMPDKTMTVSASSWSTCDSNPNCGGHFWEQSRYHSQVTLRPANISTPIYLRMMWQSGRVNWYYNTTGVPWRHFGSFTPDFREGKYFDIGVVGGLAPVNIPQSRAYFFQFGVASKYPVQHWSVRLLHPSFQYQGAWRIMEKAATIQGDVSYWKANYRWGGQPYNGVTARTTLSDPSIPPQVVEFSYTGGLIRDNVPLW